jgi:hypothetical protein
MSDDFWMLDDELELEEREHRHDDDGDGWGTLLSLSC